MRPLGPIKNLSENDDGTNTAEILLLEPTGTR